MSSSRYFNRIAATVLVLMLALTSAMLFLSRNESVMEVMAASSTDMPYSQAFSHTEIMELEISIARKDWEDMLQNPLEEEYKQCDITVNGKTYTDAAIRTKGNTSLSQVASSDSDRYSFKIEFDHYDKNKSMDGLDKLVLNNLFCDASYVKEYIAYDIFHYMGVAIPYYAFANISINGENFGCYLALEAMEDSFLQRVYGGEGQLYKPESTQAVGGGMPGEKGDEEFSPEKMMENMPWGETFGMPEMPGIPDGGGTPGMPDSGEMFDRREMLGRGGGKAFGGFGSDLIYTDDDSESYSDIFDNASFDITEQDKARVIEALKKLNAGEDLERYIDVDACLRYFAAQTFIVNLDSYYSNLKHNYYLYENNGQLTMLPWDLNLAFGGFQGSSATDAVNGAIDTPMDGLEADRPLFSKLMEIGEYQALYHTYLQEIAEGYVQSGLFGDTLSKVSSLISSYVDQDTTAFYSYAEFQTAIDTLNRFVLLRAESVEKQLAGEIPSSSEERTGDTVLVDASEVDLKVMGMQGGDGAGGKGSQDGHMFGNGPKGRGRGMRSQE